MEFFKRYQKIFFVIIFLGITVTVAYFLWKFFFNPIKEIAPAPIETPSGGSLPSAGSSTPIIGDYSGTGSLPEENRPSGVDPNSPSEVATGGVTNTEKISEDRVKSPSISSDGKVQYYNENDGKFYKIDKNGNVSLLSDKVFYNVDKVNWAPNNDKAVLEYPDGSNILYNFATGKQVTIPAHWQDFSFSPDSNSLVSKSIGLDPANSWLVISNDDGSNPVAVEKIGNNANKVYPSWSPNQSIVAMHTEGLDFNRQELFFVGQNSENFKSTIIEGRGFQSQWSDEGDRLLYSVYSSEDSLNPKLWIVKASPDEIGQSRTSLDLATWSSKCTFASNDEIYCAVPDQLPDGAGLFPELADNTEDHLYKIDLKNGTKKLVAVPNGAYNISDIVVSQDQKNLFFTDKQNNNLYKIDL